MTKLIISLAYLLCVASPALSCAMPRRGTAFDNLIEVKELKELGAYSVSVPLTAGNDTQQPLVTLVYEKLVYEKQHPQNRTAAEQELTLTEAGDHLIGHFRLSPDAGSRSYLRVYWPPSQPGLCGAVAKSRYLSIDRPPIHQPKTGATDDSQ